MQTNEIYVIFFTYVSTTKSIWFHAFVPSQQKVRHYITIHYTVHSVVYDPISAHFFPCGYVTNLSMGYESIQ